MNNNKKTLKSIVFAMVVAAGMLLPASSFAQEGAKGGMFGRGDIFESGGLFRGLMDAQGDGDPEFDITNQGIGEEAPLGSGLVILLGAGLGYVALKKKEDEQ